MRTCEVSFIDLVGSTACDRVTGTHQPNWKFSAESKPSKTRSAISTMRIRIPNALNALAFCSVLSAGLGSPATAKSLCVNPSGASGCYSTIGAQSLLAAAGDTVNIGTGEYAEDVIVKKPLSAARGRIGDHHSSTPGAVQWRLRGRPGYPGPGESASDGPDGDECQLRGILVTNASYVVIANNHVVDNDQSVNYSAGACPGQPAFETSEGDDCGEGIHLAGVSFSTVSNNNVELNAGWNPAQR